MLNQLVRAVEPRLPLDRVFAEWGRMSASLAEAPRRRALQVPKWLSELAQTS